MGMDFVSYWIGFLYIFEMGFRVLIMGKAKFFGVLDW